MAVQCPKCNSENTDTARFCSNCATSLTSLKTVPPPITKTLELPVRALTPGILLAGRYEILGQIGEGGMGEVYRAVDKNLGRHVAVKILPAAFAEDKERMARFAREAKLLAVLNHPNIAAIHGLEESEGQRFLVLELAEGETLRDRLDRGSLPLEDALGSCRELAEGLEAAHEKGIVHRDLKPGNIMIAPEGKVKILDFGLAKAYGGETTRVDIEKSPTITAQMTEPGVIMGTAAYMSPEQARGRGVDKRADIWAFGCVLYECLTGKVAFQGETTSDTIAHILKGEPDWSKLPAETPARIRDLLRRCLVKDVRERLHDVADARIEITEALRVPLGFEAVADRRLSRKWALGVLIGGPLLAAVAALVTWHFKPTAQPMSIMRSVLRIEPGQGLDGWRYAGRPTRTAFAVSNDGRFIVYSATAEDSGPKAQPQIYLRRMDQTNAAPVAGTEGGLGPFLSPDDRWIGFWTDGKLKKVSVSGGIPIALCDAASLFGADWGADNKIVFSAYYDLGLFWISGEAGKPEVLTVPDKTKGEYSHRLPHYLPGGREVLFTIMQGPWELRPRLALLDLHTGKWRTVMEDAADGRCLRSGHLVFLRQGTLMAVSYDLKRLGVKGQSVPIIANVMQAVNIIWANHNSAAGQYSVTDSGQLAYVPGGIVPDMQNSLVRVDQKGNPAPVANFKGPFTAPRFSPDGQRIAYRTIGMEWRLWIYDLNRETVNRLTGDGEVGAFTWTPDGKRLVYGWSEGGPRNLYWQPADGSLPMERLFESDVIQVPGSFTPDGSILALIERYPETNCDIILMDMKTRRQTPFLNSKANEAWPEISPDGRWLAYGSDESGRQEVWVRPFPGPGGRWQISKEGGNQPIWSKDGRQLFYRQGDQVWVADVSVEGGFSAGMPRLLFERGGFSSTDPLRGWDLCPDGHGFLMVKLEESQPQTVTEMILVQNWFEELRRLAPPNKK